MIITDMAYRIATREGFLEVFWEELCRRRAEEQTTTQISVYYSLNDLYEATYGSPMWSSWEAFRKYRDRNHCV